MTLEDLAVDIINDVGPAIGSIIRVLRVIQAVSCVLTKFLPILEGMYYDTQQSKDVGSNP